ncbi:PR5-like receptor kinase [Raphanus sativus]|nr:PR5-like receptor kinase [Raphanus sativus]
MAEGLPLMFLLVSNLFILGVTSRNITIVNKCEFTVWPGIQTTSADHPFNISGFVLKKGERREIDPPSTWKGGIWGRSRCSTKRTESFSCQTGDCNSGEIQCLGNAGTSSLTLAMFNFNNSHGQNDTYVVSVAQGYNLPLLIAPQNELTCTSIDCMVVSNNTYCTAALSSLFTCINSCEKFNLPQICCQSDNHNNYTSSEKCQLTVDTQSQELSNECPLSYDYNDSGNPLKCTNSAGYLVTFCPTSTMTTKTSKNIGPALAPIGSGTQSPFQAIPHKRAFGASVFIIIAVILIARAKHARKSSRNGKNFEAVVMLRQYSYAKVKKMTNSFAHVLGKGGFGIVYQGKLPDGGRDVAVKILKDVKGNGEEFINEIASMSRTSHVNIVPLLGFCYEGNNRAIIYDFMPNGSLDKFIAENMSAKMEWETLYKIVVGLSRGLEYLHNRCVSRIVHFDIKPQNILMDKDFCPKISDFGLARLCKNNESIMSMLDARGTFGYIAPEVVSRNFGGVSHKSDVYSYGMVVLEIIGARNREIFEKSGSNNSSMYFPDWIYKEFERGEIMRCFGDQLTEEEEKIARKMVLVGLWCIQTNPFDRPPMIKVVEMLEGSVEALQVPPKPILCLPTAAIPEILEDGDETLSVSDQSQFERCTLSAGDDTLRTSISEEDIVQCPDSLN